MPRVIAVIAVLLCTSIVLVSPTKSQDTRIQPLQIAAGTVLTFHLQARMKPTGENEMDTLPRGTLLQVKLLDAIDSNAEHDGAEFHGSIVSAIVSGNEVVVHPDSDVRGLFVLLRSASHPKGFRYELLITGLTDHGKSIALTASLNQSFSDTSSQESAPAKPVMKQDAVVSQPDKTPLQN
jgi:hypothetical protein